jgi:hypothetical protein
VASSVIGPVCATRWGRVALDLIAAIEAFIDGWNDRCYPFTWTKTADEILPHCRPGKKVLVHATLGPRRARVFDWLRPCPVRRHRSIL